MDYHSTNFTTEIKLQREKGHTITKNDSMSQI